MNYNYKELVEMATNIDVENVIKQEKEIWLSVFEKMENIKPEEYRITLQLEVIFGYCFKQTGVREKDFKRAYKKLKRLQKEAGAMWHILKAEIASRSLFGIAYIEAAEAAQGVPEFNKVLGVLVRLTKADEYVRRKREAEENCGEVCENCVEVCENCGEVEEAERGTDDSEILKSLDRNREWEALHKILWYWISDETAKTQEIKSERDWPGWDVIGHCDSNSFACICANTVWETNTCQVCPIDWSPSKQCLGLIHDTPYDKWRKAENWQDASQLAKEIADMPWKKGGWVH